MNVLDKSVKTEGWKDDLKIAKWRLLRLMLDRVSPPLPGFYISKSAISEIKWNGIAQVSPQNDAKPLLRSCFGCTFMCKMEAVGVVPVSMLVSIALDHFRRI